MKARPALLALLSATILAMAAPTEVTPLPALPPTVYAQPAGKIKVRIDGKGYLLPEELKPTVTKLLGEANYAKTRELYLGLRRTLTEKSLTEAKLRQSDALAQAAALGLCLPHPMQHRRRPLRQRCARLAGRGPYGCLSPG